MDVIRPSLALNSLHKIRRMAAIAESHYIAVAPYHNGGPLATMFGVHLGASLSNFYVQQAPFPASARDREMRAAILGGAAESGQDGFAPLVGQPGLGVRLDEEAAGQVCGGDAMKRRTLLGSLAGRDNRPRPGADAAQPAHPGCLRLRAASHAIERQAAGLGGVSRRRLETAHHGHEGVRRDAG